VCAGLSIESPLIQGDGGVPGLSANAARSRWRVNGNRRTGQIVVWFFLDGIVVFAFRRYERRVESEKLCATVRRRIGS
jgi:hypothetical protein